MQVTERALLSSGLCLIRSVFRLACELLKDNPRIRLPDRPTMYEDIATKAKSMRQRYVESRRHTIQVDFTSYMDEMAEIIGVKPSIPDFIFKDPALALSMLFGPHLPYTYRLQGPHPWPGARDAQLTAWDRVWLPTKSIIGACGENGRCTCPEESGCNVRRVRNNAMLIAIAAVVLMIMLLAIIF